MKRLFAHIISFVVFLIVIFILSKVIKPVGDFLAWWFITKEEINAPISTGQAILIDLITHLITYASVGVIFGLLGWFNGKAMHYTYVIISEVVALGLAILLRFILDYYWILFIIVGVLFVTAVIIYVITKFNRRKKDKKEVLA
ncbi:MAG: hypothetical protein K6E20_00115 [Acholeplasmatales bacterium]|nr:hypothetical protein [Acholeplasmatales bacterium]